MSRECLNSAPIVACTNGTENTVQYRHTAHTRMLTHITHACRCNGVRGVPWIGLWRVGVTCMLKLCAHCCLYKWDRNTVQYRHTARTRMLTHITHVCRCNGVRGVPRIGLWRVGVACMLKLCAHCCLHKWDRKHIPVSTHSTHTHANTYRACLQM